MKSAINVKNKKRIPKLRPKTRFSKERLKGRMANSPPCRDSNPR